MVFSNRTDKIERSVKEILAKYSAWRGLPSEITDDCTLLRDLDMDSLDVVEAIITLEDEFEVSIPDEDTEDLKTVGLVIEYIRKLVDAK